MKYEVCNRSMQYKVVHAHGSSTSLRPTLVVDAVEAGDVGEEGGDVAVVVGGVGVEGRVKEGAEEIVEGVLETVHLADLFEHAVDARNLRCIYTGCVV